MPPCSKLLDKVSVYLAHPRCSNRDNPKVVEEGSLVREVVAGALAKLVAEADSEVQDEAHRHQELLHKDTSQMLLVHLLSKHLGVPLQ